MGIKLGFTESESKKAFAVAYSNKWNILQSQPISVKTALAEARRAKRPVIAILGRPYNAFTTDANMDIPKKYITGGYSVIPFDILPFTDKSIYPNMYWYYGQQNMKASVLLKNEDNIYVTYISNFSCAPDSFLLHYLKWIMGTKPFFNSRVGLAHGRCRCGYAH